MAEEYAVSVGKRYGHLTCMEHIDRQIWRCRCDCGKTILARECMLVSGLSTSCGCVWSRCKDLSGKRFGRLTVVEPIAERAKDGSIIWKCRCDCGGTVFVSSNKLQTRHNISCGCISTSNAREAKTFVDGTCVENILSKKLLKNNTSGYRGVSRKRNGWQAYITYAGRCISLGSYDNLEDAVDARRKAEQKIREHLEPLLNGAVPEKHADQTELFERDSEVMR